MNIREIPAKPKEKKTIRVAAYARVSSDKDAAFHSLTAQRDYYEEYVSKQPDWILVGLYSDNAISGTVVERPEFQRMLQDCRLGKIDLVITKSITRFARNTVVLLQTIRELKSLDIDCYFEKEHMHSISPDGELLITLLAMYAEEEARSASENQKWRIRKKFEQGIPTNGKMLGYRLVDGKMVIIPEEAEIVRQIFADYLSGMGRCAIAKKLKQQHIEVENGNNWSDSAIDKILRNEKYTGNMLLQKTYRPDFRTKKGKKNRGEVRQYYVEDSHEAIIDAETFEEVQAEIERRRATHAKTAKPKEEREIFSSPFTGIVVCGICGKHFLRKKQKSGTYRKVIWGCDGYFRYGKEYCPSQVIPEKILIEKTIEVLGVAELTKEAITERLKTIRVPSHNHLVFILVDDSIREVEWEHTSRRKSWTPEMKEAARQRAIAQHEKRRGGNDA